MTIIANVIITLLAIAINTIILTSLVQILDMYFHFKLDFLSPYIADLGITIISQPYTHIAIAGTVIFGLVCLSLTPAVDFILRSLHNFRTPLSGEIAKLQPLFAEVCRRTGKNPARFRLYIWEEPGLNACALGNRSIGVTRSLLQLPDQEIKAVLAHEFGHHHAGDTTVQKVYMMVSMTGQAVLQVYAGIGSFLTGVARLRIPFINLIALIISWFFNLQSWLFNILLMLPLSIGMLFGSRQSEYRADRYAYEAGYGQGLYSFLNRILGFNQKRVGIFRVLRATHPPAAKRMRKLEQLHQARMSQQPQVAAIVAVN